MLVFYFFYHFFMKRYVQHLLINWVLPWLKGTLKESEALVRFTLSYVDACLMNNNFCKEGL